MPSDVRQKAGDEPVPKADPVEARIGMAQDEGRDPTPIATPKGAANILESFAEQIEHATTDDKCFTPNTLAFPGERAIPDQKEPNSTHQRRNDKVTFRVDK